MRLVVGLGPVSDALTNRRWAEAGGGLGAGGRPSGRRAARQNFGFWRRDLSALGPFGAEANLLWE